MRSFRASDSCSLLERVAPSAALTDVPSSGGFSRSFPICTGISFLLFHSILPRLVGTQAALVSLRLLVVTIMQLLFHSKVVHGAINVETPTLSPRPVAGATWSNSLPWWLSLLLDLHLHSQLADRCFIFIFNAMISTTCSPFLSVTWGQKRCCHICCPGTRLQSETAISAALHTLSSSRRSILVQPHVAISTTLTATQYSIECKSRLLSRRPRLVLSTSASSLLGYGLCIVCS